MMYWVRFAMVSVGVFFLLYVALSALLAVAWQWIKRHNLIDSADALFILRISPLSGAAFVVLLVAIPSFWSLEPISSDEGIALRAAILFLAGAAWALFSVARIYNSWRKASKFFALAAPSLRSLDVNALPAYELPGAAPNLFVAGVWRPRLFISRGAVEMLDAQEMRAAIRHELAHARSFDNFKQVVARFCSFPSLASFDREWLRAAEIAADDAAVSDELAAAELASALIKVGGANAHVAVPELGMSLLPENDAPVSARVQRLLEWKPRQPRHGQQAAQLCLLLLPVGAVAMNLVWLMTQMHRFTEVLFQ